MGNRFTIKFVLIVFNKFYSFQSFSFHVNNFFIWFIIFLFIFSFVYLFCLCYKYFFNFRFLQMLFTWDHKDFFILCLKFYFYFCLLCLWIDFETNLFLKVFKSLLNMIWHIFFIYERYMKKGSTFIYVSYTGFIYISFTFHINFGWLGTCWSKIDFILKKGWFTLFEGWMKGE